MRRLADRNFVPLNCPSPYSVYRGRTGRCVSACYWPPSPGTPSGLGAWYRRLTQSAATAAPPQPRCEAAWGTPNSFLLCAASPIRHRTTLQFPFLPRVSPKTQRDNSQLNVVFLLYIGVAPSVARSRDMPLAHHPSRPTSWPKWRFRKSGAQL